MAHIQSLFLAFISLGAFANMTIKADFYSDTVFDWGFQNTAIWGEEGEYLALMLNNVSGSGIETRKEYFFGSIEMQIKLVEGNSAGTVTTYYLSSKGSNHDEIDFEFLGNKSGQPYIIHTNVYTQGVGDREQQFYPWFDPTVDFHNYTIHWNPYQIVWLVDSIPIRVFKNHESTGVAYPKRQAMKAYSSIWNADNWATRGGLDKIDWTSAPFIARYRQLRLRACEWKGENSVGDCESEAPGNWWSQEEYSKLSYAQMGQLEWVRSNYLIYDYCNDTARFNSLFPLECYN